MIVEKIVRKNDLPVILVLALGVSMPTAVGAQAVDVRVSPISAMSAGAAAFFAAPSISATSVFAVPSPVLSAMAAPASPVAAFSTPLTGAAPTVPGAAANDAAARTHDETPSAISQAKSVEAFSSIGMGGASPMYDRASAAGAPVVVGGVVQGPFTIPGEKSETKRFNVVRQPSGRIDFQMSPAVSREFQDASHIVLTPQQDAFTYIFSGLGPIVGVSDRGLVSRIEGYSIRVGSQQGRISGYSLEFFVLYGAGGDKIGQVARYQDFDHDRDVRVPVR